MKTERFTLAHLRNEEWYRLQTEIINLIILYLAVKRLLGRKYELYKKLLEQVDKLLRPGRKNFLTEETTSEDQLRDQIFRGFREAVKALTHFPDPAIQKAAEKVYYRVEQYTKSIQSGTLAAETGAIDNLLQDLTGDVGGTDVSAEVAVLSLETWIVPLRNSNDAYKAALIQRQLEDAQKPEARSLINLRVEVDRLCSAMLNVVDAELIVIDSEGLSSNSPEDGGEGGGTPEGRTLTDDEQIVEFTKALNVIISYYKTFIENRKNKSAATEDEAPTF